MISSTDVQPAFPQGKIDFIETKEAPSRAYLKLWEAFTLHLKAPDQKQTCADLGSCPGGWTWVLASLGCKVWSIDKAPLAPHVENMKNVTSIKKDAFSLKPLQALDMFGLNKPLDWFFSDIICDPKRLLELVREWRSAGAAKNFLCTIKFKGKTDFETMNRFLEISNSRAFHLNHNKHEVTWVSHLD
jgi:23S rRNA (cytidine2498-2'-O)-methyltransferase